MMIEGHFIARSQLIVKVTQVFIAFISLWVNGKLAKISVSSITSISSGQTNKSLQLLPSYETIHLNFDSNLRYVVTDTAGVLEK